ncbi:hypothetical protein HDU91_006132, partial [Kappamyces sp. JEL0680]
ALFNTVTEQNQAKLLTALVNTVVIGNYTPTANGRIVKGILAEQTFQGQQIKLLPFFTGDQGKTANINGKAMDKVNFLDGGGAAPLKQNLPADPSIPNSRQQKLLTHLYSLFAALTGCSTQTATSKILTQYQGNPSMTDVHRFMNLNKAQISFFNDMVGQAALGFGVATADAQAVGTALEGLFNIQCGKPAKLVPNLSEQPQGFCLGAGCQVSNAETCGSTSIQSSSSRQSASLWLGVVALLLL